MTESYRENIVRRVNTIPQCAGLRAGVRRKFVKEKTTGKRHAGAYNLTIDHN